MAFKNGCLEQEEAVENGKNIITQMESPNKLVLQSLRKRKELWKRKEVYDYSSDMFCIVISL